MIIRCQNNGTCVPGVDTEVFTCDCDGDFCGPLCGDTPANNCGLLAGSEGATTSPAVLGGIGALVGLLLLLVVAMVFVIRRRNRNIIIPEAMPIVPREKPDEWEIEPRSLLTIGKLIGEGHFGSVSPHRELLVSANVLCDRCTRDFTRTRLFQKVHLPPMLPSNCSRLLGPGHRKKQISGLR